MIRACSSRRQARFARLPPLALIRLARAAAFAIALAPFAARAQAPVPGPSQIPTPVGGVPEGPLDADDRVWTPASSGLRESRVTAIAASPSNPKNVVAATSRGAVYRSSDGGRSWTQVLRVPAFERARERESEGSDAAEDADAAPDPDGLSEEDVEELEDLREQVFQDTVDELTEVVGEDEAERIANEEADAAIEERREELIERTQDDGDVASREETDDDAPPAARAVVREVTWDPQFPGLVYLATQGGVWRSGDDGSNWVRLNAGVGADENNVLSIAPSAGNADRILLGTKSGVLVSEDGGLGFSNADGEVGSSEVRTMAVDPENRSVVAVGTVTGAFVSPDGGRTWRKVWSGVGASADVRALAFRRGDETGLIIGTGDGLHLVSPEGSVALGVAQFSSSAIRSVVAPRGDSSHLYVATARSVHESLDGGRTFAELYRGLATPNVIALSEEHSNPDSVWGATALGVYRLLPEGAMAVASGKVGGPTIGEMVRAAERYHYYDARTVNSWRRNTRLSLFLPRVTAVWRTDQDDEVTTDVTEIRDINGTVVGHQRTPSAFDHNTNHSFLVTLTWRFDEILHGGGKAQVTSLARTLITRRSRKLAEVARLARERRDVAGRLAGTVPESPERAALEIRFQELSGYLDGVTGGALSGSRKPAPAPPPKEKKLGEEVP